MTALHTINDLNSVITREFKNRVIELEQQVRDAEAKDLHSYARELKQAARELEVFRYRIDSVFTAVFIDELERSVPTRQQCFEIQKPSIELPELTPVSPVEVIS